VAAFMLALGPARYPHWVRDVARERISLVSILLDPDASASAVVANQMQKLLNGLPDLLHPPLSGVVGVI
jgi:hypothetical protein